jgi:hypothetical protein
MPDYFWSKNTFLYGTVYKLIFYFLMHINSSHFGYTDYDCHLFVATDSEAAEWQANDGRCPSRGEGSSALELRALARSASISVSGRAERTHQWTKEGADSNALPL